MSRILLALMLMLLPAIGWASTLEELEGMTQAPVSASEPQALRETALKETAVALGVQAGAAERYQQLLQAVEKSVTPLDAVYNFQPLLLHDGQVLPPVIRGTDGSRVLANALEAISADVSYSILQDARFVMSPPSWRDYLAREFKAPKATEINEALLPRDDRERELWKEAVRQGWQAGVAQADAEFEAQLDRLARDFQGMVLFHRLSRQGIVSLPLVANSRVAVVINGKELEVNQRTFRITEGSGFQSVKEWTPGVAR